jgi:hypothetical protein
MGRLQNNPSIGWVHPKSTHAHPLAWDNKYHGMSIMGKNKRENILCKCSMLVNDVPKMSTCLGPTPRGTYFGNASLLGHYPIPNSDPYIYVTYIPKGQIKAIRQGPVR